MVSALAMMGMMFTYGRRKEKEPGENGAQQTERSREVHGELRCVQMAQAMPRWLLSTS